METVARDATWLLLSPETVGRNRSPRLADVIARADAINHDVMGYAGFERGVALLLAAGFVQPPEGLRLTRAGQTLLKSSGRGPWHERWQVIEAELEQLTGVADSAQTSVTARAFDDAVREYLARHE